MKSTPVLALVAAAAVTAVAVTGSAAATPRAKTPPRHVICSKASTWIPVDYNGGCYLTFTPAVRRIAYDAFANAARLSSQWQGSDDLAPLDQTAIVAGMRCTRGGMAGLVRLNKWQAGRCTWTDTYGHYGLGDHPDHTWECEVTVVVRTGPNGKSRVRGTRASLQWDVTAAPLDDASQVNGEWPNCEKNPDDTW